MSLQYGENCTQYQLLPPPTTNQQLYLLGDFGTGVAIAGACTTSFLAILFAVHLYLVIKYCPPSRRRILSWTISLPFVVSLFSLIAFVIPKSGWLCDAVKAIYMPFLLTHLVDLATVMRGGQGQILKDLVSKSTRVNFCVPLCCWFGLCFRDLSYNKKKLRIIKALVYQSPLFQLTLVLLNNILSSSQLLPPRKQANVSNLIELINMCSFITGMWAYNVLAAAFAKHSLWKNHLVKCKVLGLSITFLRAQYLVLSLMMAFGAVPCVAPLIPSRSYRTTLDSALTLGESFLFGILYFFVYREQDSRAEIRRPLEEDFSSSTPSETIRGHDNLAVIPNDNGPTTRF